MYTKEKLNAMKTGETKDHASNPCYPVLVVKLGADRFTINGKSYTLAEATRQLRPFGCEIY